MKHLLLILVVLGLSGCATSQALQTPSGKPEVTIQSADTSRIRSVLINEFLNAGFTVISDSENTLVFAKEMSDFGGLAYKGLMGNAYSSNPEWNVRVNMVSLGQTTRILGQPVTRMQNAFGRDDVMDMSQGKAGMQTQEILNRVLWQFP